MPLLRRGVYIVNNIRYWLLSLVLLTIPFFPGIVTAQEDGDLQCSEEDVATALDAAIADLQGAQGLESEAALEQIAQVRVDLDELDKACHALPAGSMTTAEGNRTDPIPLGQYFEFDTGIVRIAAVEDPFTSDSLIGLEDGQRAIAISLEYECQIEDPNESCKALDVIVTDAVLTDGKITDQSFLLVIGDPNPAWVTQEAFGGNTLAGVMYVAVPEEVEIDSIRMLIGFDHIYFGVK